MGKATVIPQNTFEDLQVEAGILLTYFDPDNPQVIDDYIVCATTGGIKPTCKATFSDYFEDVDNAPENTIEGKRLDKWECSIATTGLGTSPRLIKMALGAADIDSQNSSKIIPRRDLKLSDFMDSIWWVGDRADGGLVAVQLLHALSTEGFALTTSKHGKGNVALTIMGHFSIESQDEVPMIFYSIDPDESETLSLKLNMTNIVLEEGATFTLVPKTAQGATVTYESTDTSVATVTSGGVITALAEGVCVVTVKSTKSGESVMATCIVNVTAAEQGEG